MRVSVLVAGSMVLVSGCWARETPAPATESATPLGTVVAQMLAANPGWRLGTNEDCRDPGLKEKLANNPTYQAYRAIPDLDGDGQTDRVFVLVQGDSGKLYWVPGHDGGFGSAQLVARLAGVGEGGVYTHERTVLFGPFDTDVGQAWMWNSTKHAFEPVPEHGSDR